MSGTGMSALPLKADMLSVGIDVCYVPIADMNLASGDGPGPYSTGIRAGAPLFLTRTTRNFAGSVLLAFRPTT
jgi:hypothetical protein